MVGTILKSGFTIGGKYRIERPIGRGGFSNVYRATHTAMDRPVAIKVFDPSEQNDADDTRGRKRLERFQREARLVSRLEHPNTITIFDFGVEDDGRAYLVMEFIEGPTLKELLAENGALEPGRTVTIFLQVLSSLEEAHHNNILHRDLKPANIMLATNFKGDKVVKVLDFGIARVLQERNETDNDSKHNLFLGTPRYAAPEQLTGGELSLATDIYGVGALLWECLIGEPMVPTNDIRPCISHATTARPWKVPDEAGIRRDLQVIIERAVRKSPRDRYNNVSEMLQALESSTTIEKDDLPELPQSPEESPFGAPSAVFDPNVAASDSDQPHPLLDEPPDDTANSAPKGLSVPGPDESLRPGCPDGNDSGENSFPPTMQESSPLKLDLPDTSNNDTESDTATESCDAPPALSQPNSIHSSGDNMPDPNSVSSIDPADSVDQPLNRDGLSGDVRAKFAIGGLGVLLLFGLGAVILFGAENDESEPAQEAETAPMELDESELDESELDADHSAFGENSPHTVDGVIAAIRADGWQIDRTRDTVDMPRYSFRPLRISSGDRRLDIRMYQAHQQEAITDITDDISRPARYVVFDHVVVRIEPHEFRDRQSAQRLQQFLEDYRHSVAGQSEQ